MIKIESRPARARLLLGGADGCDRARRDPPMPIRAWLAGANLWRARYDSSTRWPDGFDPLERGAERVE